MDNHGIKGQNMSMKNVTINKYRLNSSLDIKIYPDQPNGSFKLLLFSIKDYVQDQLLIYTQTWTEIFSYGLVTF